MRRIIILYFILPLWAVGWTIGAICWNLYAGFMVSRKDILTLCQKFFRGE